LLNILDIYGNFLLRANIMATDFSFQWKQRGGAPFVKRFLTLCHSFVDLCFRISNLSIQPNLTKHSKGKTA